MSAEVSVLRKNINLEVLLPLLSKAEMVDYWLALNPNLTISADLSQIYPKAAAVKPEQLQAYAEQLKEEAYFQTEPLLPRHMLQTMLACIEKVKQAGFPPTFAMVYDIFYQALGYFDGVLAELLGPGYRLIPNFWVYHIEPMEEAKGFEPHRDTEYTNTIGPDGLPTVLTLWIALTEVTTLHSCMYILPANRDPQYTEAIQHMNTKADQFALEDIRALPTPAGTLSCWDQYAFHWGSRSSKRAQGPRVSYAFYCQRGDIKPVEDGIVIDIPPALDFETRLAIACRGLYRYSYTQFQQSTQAQALQDFLLKKMTVLS